MSALPLTTLHPDDASISAPNLSLAGVSDFAELVAAFNEATQRLQLTHAALQSEVSSLKADLAESNERLRRSRSLAALGEMAAGIAHEIRNPLGAIVLHAEMLCEDLQGKSGSLASAEKITRAAERLNRIVGDVLSFARDTRLSPVAIDAGDLFNMTIADCEEVLLSSDTTLERTGDSVVFAADAALLAQAMSNLVRNATEAMRNCSTRVVRIAACREKRRWSDGVRRETVVLSVEDTGPGIPLALRDSIFNPFFTTREEGTGLGLAIVHRIADAHGGQVCVTDAPGGGARIELLLLPNTQARAVAEGVSLDAAVQRRISQ